MGPMTGRAAGFCAGVGAPGYASPVGGRGRGFGGRGGGRGAWGGGGWRNMYMATGVPGWARFAGPGADVNAGALSGENELAMLKGQAAHLESMIGEIRDRMEAFEAAK